MTPLKFKLLGFSSVTIPAFLLYIKSPTCEQVPDHNLESTLLMPAISFSRAENWERIAEFSQKDPHISKFFITWHNILDEGPQIEGATLLNREPPLTQRFNASVKTEFVTIIDDDLLISPEYHKRLLFEASKTKGLVGYDYRGYDKNGNYHYHCGFAGLPDCTMVLTKTLIVRKHFLESFLQDEKAMKFVEAKNNCEDILLNFHVRKITKEYPVFVPACGHKRIGMKDKIGLSDMGDDWTKQRSSCVRWAQKHYSIL